MINVYFCIDINIHILGKNKYKSIVLFWAQTKCIILDDHIFAIFVRQTLLQDWVKVTNRCGVGRAPYSLHLRCVALKIVTFTHETYDVKYIIMYIRYCTQDI